MLSNRNKTSPLSLKGAAPSVPAGRPRTAQTTPDQAAVVPPGSYLAWPLQPVRVLPGSRLHGGLRCHPETTHWERPLHFHGGSQDKTLSHPPDAHTHQVNNGSQAGPLLTYQLIQATYETLSSLDHAKEENDATSSSALLLPNGQSSCSTITGENSPEPSCVPSHTPSSQLYPASACSCPRATTRSCQQLSSHPNPIRTRLSLAETESRRAGKERKKEARGATAKTRCPWRTVFTGNPHGISWKQLGAVFSSHIDLCLPSPEPLALESGQRKMYLC